MCGIVAVIGPRDCVDEQRLITMRERLAHRGPDGAGAWTEVVAGRVVALAHRRLAVLDTSEAGTQPMHSADGRHVVVFNGEIYNFIELRDELAAKGHAFVTRSDTEVLLAAYAEWGTECLERLNGMFAFALWDRSIGRLFVARDRFGEKPLHHVALPGGGVALASEMKALFAHPAVEATPDEEQVLAFTRGVNVEIDDRTMFREVRRLPPATALLLDRDGREVRRWRYWTPDYHDVAPGYRGREAADRFRALMEQSVRLRLRSDVPVGTSLSGGLDSSFLVCLLAQLRAGSEFHQHTFSARFDDDPTISEGPQIDLVVRSTGVAAHAVTPTPERLMADCRRLHWHQEEPVLSASIFAQWCVAALAREHGTTVLMDGQGADELLGGYAPYFRLRQLDLLDQGRWGRLALETFLQRTRLLVASRGYAQVSRRFDPRISLGLGALLSSFRSAPPVSAPGRVVGLPVAKPGYRLRGRLADAMQYDNLPMLLRYADRNAMAFGREPRLPFLDHEVVDFCLRLPDEAFIAEGWQKLILRRAGEGTLPPAIQWRADKVGYAAPLDRWLRGGMREWARARLFDGPATRLTTYDERSIRELWERHQSGAADVSWPLWRWISLGEWLAMFEDGTWRRGAP